MKIENPISKIEREKIKELHAFKELLIEKGIITDKEIKDKVKNDKIK